jgi:hypothetical protein
MMERLNDYSITLRLDTRVIGGRDCRHEVLLNCYFDDVLKYNDEKNDFDRVSEEELNEIIYEHDTLTLQKYLSCSDEQGALMAKYYKKYKCAGGFSAKRVLKCIADFETEVRPMEKNRWFGKIDQHHTFFEGLTLKDDNSYTIFWGS